MMECSEMEEEDSRKPNARLLLRNNLGFKYQPNIFRCWIKLCRLTGSFFFFNTYICGRVKRAL